MRTPRRPRPPENWWDDTDLWNELPIGSVYQLTSDSDEPKKKKSKKEKRARVGF